MTEEVKELTPATLEEWAKEEDGLGELSYYPAETPWGKSEPVSGSEYSYGDGHEMGYVVKVAGRYFHVSGTYSSWDGSDYDSVFEVEPVKVTVVRFKTLKGTVLADPVLGEL